MSTKTEYNEAVMELKKQKPKVYIFTGHYGSGKTEIAVNFAMHLKELSPERNVAIVDMDIVNPFFRTADAAKPLEEKGIRVELPLYARTNVDVPALTPQMEYLINEGNTDVVLDIGGDDVGAKAVGRYKDDIIKRDYELLFVLNKNRPFTKDMESALKIFNEIKDSCGIPFTGIVNNTHLLQFSSIKDLKKGEEFMHEFSEATGVPSAFNCIMQREEEKINTDDFSEPVFVLREYIKLLWDRSSNL